MRETYFLHIFKQFILRFSCIKTSNKKEKNWFTLIICQFLRSGLIDAIFICLLHKLYKFYFLSSSIFRLSVYAFFYGRENTCKSRIYVYN